MFKIKNKLLIFLVFVLVIKAVAIYGFTWWLHAEILHRTQLLPFMISSTGIVGMFLNAYEYLQGKHIGFYGLIVFSIIGSINNFILVHNVHTFVISLIGLAIFCLADHKLQKPYKM